MLRNAQSHVYENCQSPMNLEMGKNGKDMQKGCEFAALLPAKHSFLRRFLPLFFAKKAFLSPVGYIKSAFPASASSDNPVSSE